MINPFPRDGRDLRLDFFRGLSLFFIFIDHIPNNFLGLFTLRSFAFSDAAEVFIFISGYTAALVYGRAWSLQGPLLATAQIYRRVWQLYVAHIFLFVIFTAEVSYAVLTVDNPMYNEELQVGGFLNEPHIAIIKALLLQFQPTFLDILPLYIVLLASFPIVLMLLGRGPLWALLPAALLYALTLLYDWGLSAYPEGHRWFFNPLAWQFLFVIGAASGYARVRGGWPFPAGPWLSRLAIALAGLCIVINLSWVIHILYEPFPALLLKPLYTYTIDKTDLAPLRLVNFLVLALATVHFVRPENAFLRWPALRPIILCGQHSLYVFCLGIVLAVLGHFLLDEAGGGIAMQLAVNLAGIMLMIGTAALLAWYKTAERSRATAMRLLAILLCASLAGPSLAADAEPALSCQVPQELIAEGPHLAALAHRFEDKLPITIIAIGGASTAGTAAGNGEEYAYPQRLEKELRRRHPDNAIRVLNKGVPRQTTQEMVDRFARDVYAEEPSLVIWETGTSDAAQGIEVDVFANALRSGIAELRRRGSEIILMNMQYSRGTASVIDFAPYLDALQLTAEADEIYLFKRYEIMKYWSETGVLDFVDVPRMQRSRLAAEVYHCLALRLADAIDQAAQ